MKSEFSALIAHNFIFRLHLSLSTTTAFVIPCFLRPLYLFWAHWQFPPTMGKSSESAHAIFMRI